MRRRSITYGSRDASVQLLEHLELEILSKVEAWYLTYQETYEEGVLLSLGPEAREDPGLGQLLEQLLSPPLFIVLHLGPLPV